jgi:archaellum component FlaG (FlaF/FlaG flagellin family)
MAGSGPSAFIFLMTALIISSSVSLLLVDSWGDIAEVYADDRAKAALDAKTDIGFAGNPMKVSYTVATDTMVFYLQNTGESILDTTVAGVFVDGARPGDSVVSAVVGGGDWGPGDLLRITCVDTSWIYVDDSEVTLLIVANSEISNRVIGTDSLSLTVRLDV